MKNRSNFKIDDQNVVDGEIDFTLGLGSLMKLNLDLAGIFYVNAYLQIQEGKQEFLKLQKEIEKYKDFYTSVRLNNILVL